MCQGGVGSTGDCSEGEGVLQYLVIPIVVWLLMKGCFLCGAAMTRNSMLRAARAGRHYWRPNLLCKSCCGDAVIFYWEGSSRNFWNACILPCYALFCWYMSPLPKINNKMITVIGAAETTQYGASAVTMKNPIQAATTPVTVAATAIPVQAVATPVTAMHAQPPEEARA